MMASGFPSVKSFTPERLNESGATDVNIDSLDAREPADQAQNNGLIEMKIKTPKNFKNFDVVVDHSQQDPQPAQ